MTSHDAAPSLPVLILGAGINGAALARELVLNRVPVWLVDTADIAAGTTAYSSRLIHGGLRYLEYGEFHLVRESLAERTRLLRLAPQYVRPLELFIPVRNRCGGLLTSVRRFLRLERATSTAKDRGLWLVRFGLWLYDQYARDPSLPRSRRWSSRDAAARHTAPQVDADRYPWLCAYYDAQVAFPERFTLAMVEDARRAAHEQATEFRHLTYTRATLEGRCVQLRPVDPLRPYADHLPSATPLAECEPALIVNATGAWVDDTLRRLHVAAPRLLGGTKGTHFFTRHAALRQRLGGRAIYGEATDGRPVFVLPLADGTLVGTTDERFDDPAEEAHATEAELTYLIQLVNHVLPGLGFSREDVAWHYAGVRPLPNSSNHHTASITRRHFLQANPGAALPLFSILGGKLTTCRSLAQDAAAQLLKHLRRSPVTDSRERPLPGAEGYPANPAELDARQRRLCQTTGLLLAQVQAIWALLGTRAEEVLRSLAPLAPASIPDTPFPRDFVRWVIRAEWPRTLDDLVERRLMLLYLGRPTPDCLTALAELLVEAGLLDAEELSQAVARTLDRLATHFGCREAPAAVRTDGA